MPIQVKDPTSQALSRRDRVGHCSGSISLLLKQARLLKRRAVREHSIDEMAIPLHVGVILERYYSYYSCRCPENEDSGSKITLIARQTPKIRRE